MCCQPQRVTSKQSNSGHKQMHISILFKPFVKSSQSTKISHFANIKQNIHTLHIQMFFGRSSDLDVERESSIPNTSHRTAPLMHLKVQAPEHSLHNCLLMHLKVQHPEHILQNCPTHVPESPGSRTHPTELPHSCT